MRYFYAQLDGNNVCVAQLDTHGIIDAPNMIPVAIEDDRIGQTWDGANWQAAVPTYSTQLDETEFIGLFTFDEWSDVKGSADASVQKFVAVLESFPKKFDTGHAKVVAAMTKIVQAGDVSINQTRAQEIVKGILR